jgi:hypothetical protein
MNPEKLRDSYGKLLCLLQDSANPQVQELLGFSLVKPIRTVYRVLEECGGLALLADPDMDLATKEILSEGRARGAIQREIQEKNAAVKRLVRKYTSASLDSDLVELCIYSFADANSNLNACRRPVDQMISWLERHFRADEIDGEYSLAIAFGRGGARLSHHHATQFVYVRQTLELWREVMHSMQRLWILAEDDMLSERNPYRLCDTGQGLNRVQPAPLLSRAMSRIIRRVMHRVGQWVGSAVVHLGDHAVPSALTFIDKYTQVPRILAPLCLTLDSIAATYKNVDGMAPYIDATYGSVDDARKTILCDFVRHGFDGSGANNFFDAGSCIDGRLTSAWNWCEKVHKKPYYPLFQLAGFMSFDGDFR